MRRRLLQGFVVLAGLSVLPFVGGPAFADGEEPRDVVVAMYEQSAGLDGKYQGESAYFDKKVQQRYFSKALRAAIAKRDADDKKVDNEAGIGFDPLTNSQDPSVANLQIDVAKRATDKITVTAKFNQFETPTTVFYIFVPEGSAWKIDDIKGGSGADKWSVRELLENG